MDVEDVYSNFTVSISQSQKVSRRSTEIGHPETVKDRDGVEHLNIRIVKPLAT